MTTSKEAKKVSYPKAGIANKYAERKTVYYSKVCTYELKW